MNEWLCNEWMNEWLCNEWINDYLGTERMLWRLVGLLPGVLRLLQAPCGLWSILQSLSTSLAASTPSRLLKL